jgi:uncharacterized protein (DUF1501 family)
MSISRRKFLTSGLGVLSISLGGAQFLGLAAQALNFDSRKIGQSKILVTIQLAGGNDGINTVIPYGVGQYYQVRPQINIPEKEVLPLTNQIGLHPSMTGLRDLYKAGKVGIILGAGYPNPNRSHFRSIEIWQTANPDQIIETGWLGRYLDLSKGQFAEADYPLPAVNVDSSLPKTLSATQVVVPSVANVYDFKFSTDQHYQQDRKYQLSVFNDALSKFDDSQPSIELLKKVGLDSVEAADYLLKVVQNYKSNVVYPDNGFGKGMKFIAQMITAGVKSQVYNISLGSFDTHAGQKGSQANLLKQLSDGITAFQKDLEEHKVDKDVLLMTFSEFGRRVAENGGRGTDHGTAEPMLIVGSRVKGGLYGDYPSLTNLDNGDLKFEVDFRTVYSTVLDRWLGADSRQILGANYENIPFV